MTIATFENFLEIVLKASGSTVKPEAPHWAKFVDSVDFTQKGGYMFVGDFISEKGTTKVELGAPHLLLSCAAQKDALMKSGFRRYFRVVILDHYGTLKPSHISTDDGVGGWANRICTLVKNLLDELQRGPGELQIETPNRFSMLDVGEEPQSGLISTCDGCGSRKLTNNLLERDNAHLCWVCAELADRVIEWGQYSKQTKKAHELISIISKRDRRT
jgi:hypothetical protein